MPEVRITATTDVSFPTRGVVHLTKGDVVTGDFATYLLDADSDFVERCDGATPEQIEAERLQDEAVAALLARQDEAPAEVTDDALVVPLDTPEVLVDAFVAADAPVSTPKAPSPADVAKAKV